MSLKDMMPTRREPSVAMESPTRRALRDRKLDELGPRPPWWRVLARRRWTKRHDAIMAMGITIADEILAQHYNSDTIRAIAERQEFTFPRKPMKTGAPWTVAITREADK